MFGVPRARSRHVCIGLALTLGGLFAPLSLARAQTDPLGEADAAYEAADLDTALQAYDRAVRGGGLDPDVLLHVALRLVVVRSAVGDPAGASEAARLALALDPSAAVPAELDRATATMFERERRETRQPLSMDVQPVAEHADGHDVILVRVTTPLSDCELLVLRDGARLGAVVRLAVGETQARLALDEPFSETSTFDVEVRDATGNTLRRNTVRVQPAPASASHGSAGPRDGAPLALGVTGIVLAVLGAGALAVGGALTLTEHQALLDRCAPACGPADVSTIDATRIVADVGLGVLGLGAILAVIGFVLDASLPNGATARRGGPRWAFSIGAVRVSF